MRTRPLKSSYMQLGLVFVVLVLVPSFLLGYFGLRAVDNERFVTEQRLQADRSRYAEFAARAVHRELESLENVWVGMVPRRVGWERDLDTVVGALEAAKGQAFVRTSHLLHVSGDELYPRPTAAPRIPALAVEVPDADAAERLEELLQEGEAAEFDRDEPAAALTAYSELLAIAHAPRLRAIAHAGIGRAHMRLQNWQAAIDDFHRILAEYPEAYDLDNQPLRLQAWLHTARAREEMGQALPAAIALVSLYEDLVEHSDAIGRLQYDIVVERIEARLARLLPRPLPEAWKSLEARHQKVRGQAKKPVGTEYFTQKLSRKLIRASLDGLPYSTTVHYLSDHTEGHPFLLAYLYLPDATGTLVAGLVGFEIDLVGLSQAMLPTVLRELEPGEDVSLALVDAGDGEVVAGDLAAAETQRSIAALGAPFDFWSLAMSARSPDIARSLDFRTKVFLYFVLLLLVTIGVGALTIGLGLRREARLARLKTGFVSSVSHELRTPLTAIRMFTEILEVSDERSSPEQRRDYLRTIQRECARLQRLIDQVLDFAKHERGTQPYHFEYEEIGALVRGVAEDFRAQAESAGFEYAVEIQPDLPELRVDRDAIRQMLLNLLANAVQYSDKQRSIIVRAWREDGDVGVMVQDHGIGIEAAERDRIFEDFYRGDPDSKRHSGLGLGLALVRRIVAAHAARIHVASSRGEGSTFTIWLPIGPGEPAAAKTHVTRVGSEESHG